ncbi:MAG: hypothetical protein NT066_06030, partial [Candidatus Omnitrophica bacterium]|nr:hypothetical protein [Candidatus Omnitrophota bacterium]
MKMAFKVFEKISNITGDTKFLFLMIFIIISTLLLQNVYKKRESVLLGELRSIENRNDELGSRLNDSFKSIEPLKAEINNLRRMVLVEKTLVHVNVADKKDQIISQDDPTSASVNKTVNPGSPAPVIQPKPLLVWENKANLVLPVSTDTEKSLARLKDYMKEIEEQNGILKKRSDELGSLLNLKEQEMLKLNKANLALREDLDKAAKSQKELKEEFKSQARGLGDQLKQKENEVSQLNNVKASFQGRVTELQARITGLMKTNADLEKQLSQKGRDNSFLETELNKIKGELSWQKSDVEAMRKKIVEAKEGLEQKEEERTGLLRELAQLKEFKKSTEAALEYLRLKS